jgi:hypothetical protein
MNDVAVSLIPIVTTLGLFSMIVAIVIANARSRQRQAELNAEVQTRLIDRFGSAPELINFLQTPEGQKFLGSGPNSGAAVSAQDRIIRSMGKAVVLTLLGAAFLLICLWPETRNEGFFIAGCILAMLGIGYFLSAIVSLKLSRNWGLIEQRSQQNS